MTKIQFSIVKNNEKQDANEESMEKILELMNLEREHRTREYFVRDFFETAKANGIDVTRGYKFNYNDEKLAAITKRISNIINSFK